jgi:hypothetical protein
MNFQIGRWTSTKFEKRFFFAGQSQREAWHCAAPWLRKRGGGGGSGSRWCSQRWRGGKEEEEGGGSLMCARWRRGLGIREAVNERRRGGFLTGRGGLTEALWGAAIVALSFRSVVEREQLGWRASAWDDECGGGVGRRVAHRRT